MLQVLVRLMLGLSRASKRALQLVADVLALMLAFSCAMLLRLETADFLGSAAVWAAFLPVLPLSVFGFMRLGLYRAVVRYTAGHAVATILVGAMLSSVVLSVIVALVEAPVPATVPVIYGVLVFVALGGIRFAFREMVRLGRSGKRQPVVVYGAGDAGRKLVRVLREGSVYRPVGFVDDSAAAQGTQVAGLTVHAPSALGALLRRTGAGCVILALPAVAGPDKSTILRWLEQFDVTLLTVPAAEDIVAGRARLRGLRNVTVDEVFARSALLPQDLRGRSGLAGKVVLVTAAAGTAGGALCREILACGPRRLIIADASATALGKAEQDLVTLRADDNPCEISSIVLPLPAEEALAAVMQRHGVQVVYHCAEPFLAGPAPSDMTEMVRCTVLGTRALLRAAFAANAERFVMLSSDKAARPVTMAAAALRAAEMICQAKARLSGPKPRITVLRLAGLVPDSGSLLTLFRRQIEAGGPLTVPHAQMARSLLAPSDMARLVLAWQSEAGAGCTVYGLETGGDVNLLDLATRYARLHGLRAVVQQGDAPRPLRAGEIGVRITGLRPGELLGEGRAAVGPVNPSAQPRIVAVAASGLSLAELGPACDRILRACAAVDIDSLAQALDLEPAPREGDLPAVIRSGQTEEQRRLAAVRG